MVVKWDSGPVDARVRQAALRAVVTAVEAIQSEGTRLIASPPKSGRVYTRRGVKHQASAPGQPPATDLGALVGSARADYPAQQDLFIIKGSAVWSTPYAIFLELGTRRMEPRPFARPALDMVAPGFVAGMGGELSRELSIGAASIGARPLGGNAATRFQTGLAP